MPASGRNAPTRGDDTGWRNLVNRIHPLLVKHEIENKWVRCEKVQVAERKELRGFAVWMDKGVRRTEMAQTERLSSSIFVVARNLSIINRY